MTSLEMMVVTGDRSLIETRAALALADPLMRALGRPNREQVVTTRPAVATTLEALELTNGQELTGLLAQGAARWTRNPGPSGPILVQISTRPPSVGPPSPPSDRSLCSWSAPRSAKEGVEDLLWALVMLPEFQLVY